MSGTGRRAYLAALERQAATPVPPVRVDEDGVIVITPRRPTGPHPDNPAAPEEIAALAVLAELGLVWPGWLPADEGERRTVEWAFRLAVRGREKLRGDWDTGIGELRERAKR